MNDTQEVSIKFINTVTGDSKLKEYEKRLENIYGYISSIKAGQSKATKEVKNAVEGLGKEVDKTKEKTKGLSNTMKTAFNVAGIIATIKASAKLFKTLSQLVDLSSSYVENLNLLQVAYADIDEKTGKFNRSIEETSEEIQNFIDKMADVYGLDESKLTRQFGIFRQLANAMKLPTETGSQLSELMVKMTNDIASLYNLPIDRASNALQSALAGQPRPIRLATGADITEKSLQNTVDALGLDRSISQLSFVEKRLIMVISLTDQLKKSQGDWGRTIESVANQVRIMQEQWNRLSRAVGNVFYPILEKILPYLNAVLMVLTEIFNLIASLMGFKIPEFDYSGLTGASDATLDLIDGMHEAGASADNLKDKLKGLRGFDKLNVINTPTDSSSSAGAGIDPAILDAFNASFSSYNDKMDEVNMKARQIRDDILDWLGFTDGTYKNLKLIGIVLGTLSALKIFSILSGLFTGNSLLGKLLHTGGLYKLLTKIIQKIKDLNVVSKIASVIFSPTGLLLGGLVALVAIFINLYKNNEEFRKKVDKLVDTIKSSLEPVLKTTTEIFKKLMETIKNLWDKALKPLVDLIKDILEPVFEAVIDVLQVLIERIIKPLVEKWLKKVQENWEKISNILNDFVIPAIEGVIKTFDWLWKNILKPIVKFIEDTLIVSIQGIVDFVTGIFTGDWEKAWNAVKNTFEKIFNGMKETATTIINGIISGLETALQKNKELWGYMTTNETTGKTGWSGFWANWWEGVQGWFKADGGVFANGGWHDITTYASGGLPPIGQMFVARENGPELVGKIGSHTAVMNNDQIVGSVSDGVYRAMINANRGQSQGTQVYNIYLDESHKLGTYTLEQLQDMAKTNGKPITITG